MINSFNPTVATQFGVNTALFIQHIAQWTFNNLANKRNIRDGYCWSYDTLHAMLKIFPYWTRRQLEVAINLAVKQGLIKRGNYNKNGYDRTCWYALEPKAYALYSELHQPDFVQLLGENYIKALCSLISPKCEMDFTKMGNGFHQNVTPIPTIDPTNKPSNTIVDLKESTDYKNNDLFMSFYDVYPLKEKPRAAYKAFLKLKPNSEFVDMLIEDVKKRIDNNWKGRDKSKLPHPSSYLTQKQWEGEIYPAQVHKSTNSFQRFEISFNPEQTREKAKKIEQEMAERNIASEQRRANAATPERAAAYINSIKNILNVQKAVAEF